MVAQMLDNMLSRINIEANDVLVRFHHVSPYTRRSVWLDVRVPHVAAHDASPVATSPGTAAASTTAGADTDVVKHLTCESLELRLAEDLPPAQVGAAASAAHLNTSSSLYASTTDGMQAIPGARPDAAGAAAAVADGLLLAWIVVAQPTSDQRTRAGRISVTG